MRKLNVFKTLIVIIILIFPLLFNFCSKDDSENGIEPSVIQELEISSKMLSFNSFNEYIETRDKLLSMNFNELTEWEESQGFVSIGRACDEFYNQIKPEGFKSNEEIKEFVSKNSNYVQLVEDENGELSLEVVEQRNIDRYILNKERMFRINDNVFKRMDNQIVSTNISNIKILEEINDNNISLYFQKPEIKISTINNKVTGFKLKDAGNNCGTALSGTSTSDKNRLILNASITYQHTYDNMGYPMTILYNVVEIKNQKKTLGVWFAAKRTTSYNFELAIDIYENNQWTREFAYASSTGDYFNNMKWYIESGVISNGVWVENRHYGAYDMYADNPDVSPVTKTCNTGIL